MHNQQNPLLINFSNELASPILPFVLMVAVFPFVLSIVKSLAVITFSIILTTSSCFNLKWIPMNTHPSNNDDNVNDEALRPE